MTETDATVRPLMMPEKFIPYLEKFRIYKLFKDMAEDVIINLPRDHLKHMRVFFGRRMRVSKDIDRIMVLVSPEVRLDIIALVRELRQDLGCIAISRRYIVDHYEKDDKYVPGCISPVLMSAVTKKITGKEIVAQAGWLMFDHPCTVREARCMQQDGLFPMVTLALIPTPGLVAAPDNPFTPSRNFFQQDFEGLKFAYKATIKYVHIDPEDDISCVSSKCYNAIRACAAGLQGAREGYHMVGAPGVYRVVLIGPRGSGCRTQAAALAKHFGLVYLYFEDLFREAKEKKDEIGAKLRNFNVSVRLRAEIVKNRIMQKDCIDFGWVLCGYPTSGAEFELLDNMSTPPNRVIFLNLDVETCKKRLTAVAVDWCTGRLAVPGSGPRVLPYPRDSAAKLDEEMDYYYSEALGELKAAAGFTAVEVDARQSYEHVQVKIQAAVMAAPAHDIEHVFR